MQQQKFFGRNARELNALLAAQQANAVHQHPLENIAQQNPQSGMYNALPGAVIPYMLR